MTTTEAEPTVQAVDVKTPVQLQAESLYKRLRLKAWDLTEDKPVRRWSDLVKQAEKLANEQTMMAGDMFITISAHPRGYWVSEWSVIGKKGDRKVSERRSAKGRDLDATATAMLHQAGYARPPRQGLFSRKKKRDV